MRSSVEDNWQLANLKNNNFEHSIVQFLSDLPKTPAKELVSPTDWKFVSDRINSKQGRIQNHDNISCLYQLRDDLYRDRKLFFHWDMNNDIEFKDIDSATILSEIENLQNTKNDESESRFDHNLLHFGEVKSDP